MAIMAASPRVAASEGLPALVMPARATSCSPQSPAGAGSGSSRTEASRRTPRKLEPAGVVHWGAVRPAVPRAQPRQSTAATLGCSGRGAAPKHGGQLGWLQSEATAVADEARFEAFLEARPHCEERLRRLLRQPLRPTSAEGRPGSAGLPREDKCQELARALQAARRGLGAGSCLVALGERRLERLQASGPAGGPAQQPATPLA